MCVHTGYLIVSGYVFVLGSFSLLANMHMAAAGVIAVGCADVISAGQGFVESASNLVPESVPRPVAKGGVAVATGLVAFWILQKVGKQPLKKLYQTGESACWML
jgi:hypothetical protein